MEQSNDILIVVGTRFPSNNAPSVRIISLAEKLADRGYSVSIVSCGKLGLGKLFSWERPAAVRVWNIIPAVPFGHALVNALNVIAAFVIGILGPFGNYSVILFSVPPIDNALGFDLGLRIRKCLSKKTVRIMYDYRDDVLDEEYVRRGLKGFYPIDKYLLKVLLRSFRSLLKRSDLIVCTTPRHRLLLIRRGFDAARIHVIANGANTLVFQPRSRTEKAALRAKYGIPLDSFVLVVVTEAGWLYQRLEPTIVALKIMFDELPSSKVRLLIMGRWTRELMTYLDLARQLGVDGSIVYFGEVPHDRVPELLGIADVGIVPYGNFSYLKTTLPVKLFEYCSCGLPVLVTAPEGSLLEEVVRDHCLGLVYGPTDAEGLANGALKLLGDEKMRRNFGRNCRATIEEEYDRALLSARYCSIIDRILHKGD